MTDAPLEPIADADWPEAVADMRDGFAGRLNVYRTMAHNPALLRAWRDLRGHVVETSALTEQQREIVILRTGWHWQSDYEWAHHVWRGRRVELSEARIERTRADPAAWVGDDEDLILLRVVHQLLTGGRLDAATLAEARGRLSDAAILDVMATVGFYTTLAFIVRTHGTPIDGFVLDGAA